MQKGKNIKGISSIVATVLIILITVAAIAIIWATIVPMIRNNLDDAEFEESLSIVDSEGFTAVDAGANPVCVQVRRGMDNLNMIGVQIIYSYKGNSYRTNEYPAPERGGERRYCNNISGYEVPDSVRVAPIIKKGESTVVGNAGEEVDLPEGNLDGVPVTPINGDDPTGRTIPECHDVSCDDKDSCTNQDIRVCDSNGILGKCEGTPIVDVCSAPADVECGESIEVQCGTCSGTGTLCDVGERCVSGQCLTLNPILTQYTNYWKFDTLVYDGLGGHFFDETGNANGTFNAHTSYNDNLQCVSETNCFRFIPNSAYAVTDSKVNFSTNFSISIWVYPELFKTTKQYFSTIPELYFLINSTNFSVTQSSNPLTIQGGPVKLNEWNHLVFNFVGNTKVGYLYVNNNFVGSATFSAWTGVKNNQLISLGNVMGTSEGFTGSIDELMLYNRTLSSSEINAIYTADYSAYPLA